MIITKVWCLRRSLHLPGVTGRWLEPLPHSGAVNDSGDEPVFSDGRLSSATGVVRFAMEAQAAVTLVDAETCVAAGTKKQAMLLSRQFDNVELPGLEQCRSSVIDWQDARQNFHSKSENGERWVNNVTI